jgi:predicted SnoaL-like aldol condensation-catalyzing enzyme
MILQNLISQAVRPKMGIVLAVLLAISLTAACTPQQVERQEADAQAQLERNKEIAVAFLEMVLNEHKVAEAFERYSVPGYINHNPYAADGAQAAIDFFAPFFEQTPTYRIDIKRVIAEGDLVAIHNHATMNPDDRGRAVVDIFRLEDGRVVEHWDVVQDIPEFLPDPEAMF